MAEARNPMSTARASSTIAQEARDAAFAALARPSGTFAMVAIDQRESLRTMLSEAAGADASDVDLVSFKLSVIRALRRHASAFLLDHEYGLGPAKDARLLPDGAGLIVAADRLIQPPGEPVRGTELDRSAVEPARAAGAVALKLLVLWDPASGSEERERLVSEFVAVCRAAGLLSVVEGVVRPRSGIDPSWAETVGILDAATELARPGPDLYKTQVPTLGKGGSDEIEAWSRRLTAIVQRPWVVLSSGVRPTEFPRAVEAAGRGGASGFLAGRAIWTGALKQEQRMDQLEQLATPLLVTLGRIVDEHARPWRVAVARSTAEA